MVDHRMVEPVLEVPVMTGQPLPVELALAPDDARCLGVCLSVWFPCFKAIKGEQAATPICCRLATDLTRR